MQVKRVCRVIGSSLPAHGTWAEERLWPVAGAEAAGLGSLHSSLSVPSRCREAAAGLHHASHLL